MIIKKATIDDAAELITLHSTAVLALCQDDYTPELLHVWVNASSLEIYQHRLIFHRSYVV